MMRKANKGSDASLPETRDLTHIVQSHGKGSILAIDNLLNTSKIFMTKKIVPCTPARIPNANAVVPVFPRLEPSYEKCSLIHPS